jgi:hypothetical protein
MLRFVHIFIFVLFTARYVTAADTCTFGTDCFCACVNGANRGDGYANNGCADDGIKVKPVGSTIRMCDDYEEPAYYATSGEGYWLDGSGGPYCGALSNYTGCDSAWYNNYGGGTAENCSWTSGQGGCAFAACATMADWTSGNTFGSNSLDTCIDLQGANEQDDEIAGLTLTNNYDGSKYLAARYAPDNCSDKLSSAITLGSATEVWVTFRMGFSDNFTTAHGNYSPFTCTGINNDYVPRPLKMLEWGTLEDFFFFGNATSTSGAPFSPYICSKGGLGGTCETAMDAAMTAGTATCNPNGGYCGGGTTQVINFVPTATYDRSDDWPTGTFALVRAHIVGLGTSNCSYTTTFWHEDASSEVTVLSWSGLDCSSIVNMNNLSSFTFNPFYNGGRGECETVGGCHTTQTWYVYWDNFLVGTGSAPPSAADLGWVATGVLRLQLGPSLVSPSSTRLRAHRAPALISRI